MWPFSQRGSRLDASPRLALPVALPADLSLFAINDAVVKLWLPQKLLLALDSLSSAQAISRPDVLRWLFFEHVYGRPALEQLKSWKRQQEVERLQC